MNWIAEISSNHNQDLARAMKLIDAAKLAGATAVKFQLFRVEQLFAPEALRAKPELLERKNWELPLDFLAPLAEHAHRLEMQFGCTPFYLDAIDQLYPYVDFYKLASYQVPWLDFIGRVAIMGKPIVMSVGMADEQEIARAVETVRANRNDQLTLLHCVSHYPAMSRECNLATIDYLAESFNVLVGWSDHTVNPFVLYTVANNPYVQTIEFHLDLDGKGNEYKLGHCWRPKEIAKVIFNVNHLDEVYGAYGIISRDSELDERMWRSDPLDGMRPNRAVRGQL